MIRRKRTTQEALNALPLPEPPKSIIACSGGPRGSNNHVLLNETGQETLGVLPGKFRNLVFLKRGSYVIAKPFEYLDNEAVWEKSKVCVEIDWILNDRQIKYIQQQGLW